MCADAGMFKKKKERKHLVPWIHRKHRKSLSSEPEDPSGALDEQLSLTVYLMNIRGLPHRLMQWHII